MKLIIITTLITLVTLTTALSHHHDRVDTYQPDPKIRQSILKGRQLNPHKSIAKRMVKYNIAPAVSTDAYQQDPMMSAFQQFSSFMVNNHVPSNSFHSPSLSSFMESPQPMIHCVRYPCSSIQPPTRFNSPPPRSSHRSSGHHRPPPRKSRQMDTSETEEQTTELEEAFSYSEEGRENTERLEAEENENEKPEKAENENEKNENENEKPEKAEKEETEHRPGPGEEA
ncbi:hypothetical protein K501DRAFT_303524 [Backusella circina FSU 941]|nr:hypothetical protein K501DRAFT_303524 [Backusella circina FSU 941]